MSSRSTTKTTLALIPYLNCEPFYFGIDDLDFEIVREVPRELGRLADSGLATCGPMAVADWFRLRDRYDLLDDFGIACEGPAHSVLLFSKREIQSLNEGRVGLTTESSTSVRLVRVILGGKYGARTIEWGRGASDEDDARLLIGDQALRAATTGLDDFPFVYDLGEEWHGWQGLPFVFARWVVAKEIPAEDRERISASLSASLASWRLRVPEIAARRGPDFGLEGEGILRYLSTFRYRIGPVEALGEQTFETLLEEYA
ncbi:MAG: menaquinone biosynthesis protein [Gemmatimonadetes bacterium]|nr:menaquinone biosynthesis protein [Gemmatimonadota bacterium]